MDMAQLVEVKRNPNIPDIAPGDNVKVSVRIIEGEKERIQVFKGVVIKLHRGGVAASFTVRHVSYGIGVERTFPFTSLMVEKVEVVRHARVRRAKLYYLRGLSGKAARKKVKLTEKRREELLIPAPVPEPPAAEASAPPEAAAAEAPPSPEAAAAPAPAPAPEPKPAQAQASGPTAPEAAAPAEAAAPGSQPLNEDKPKSA